MKERPILFSAPMVRAILAGTKMQTRRVVKPQPPASTHQVETWHHPDAKPRFFTWTTAGEISDQWEPLPCPYGQPGDRLWVRETFRGCRAYEVQGYAPKDWGNKPIWFAADGTPPGRPEQWALRSRPSIHMPRWASRITLEVTDVRVERLQDISEADAVAEGVKNSLHLPGGRFATENFAHLWWSINGDGSWEANPWVWVVEFKRIEGAPA